MICHVCRKKNIRKIKTVKGVDIFECRNCQLAFVDQAKKNTLDPQEEYSLEGYRENEEQFRTRLGKLVERIYEYKRTGNILDVGAGYGLLSSMLYDKGYNIEIIEPMNEPYYLKGKKIRHYKTSIEEFLLRTKSKYDIILLMDVIEHLKDPLKTLSKLKKILHRKGIIVIQTPNYKSLMARICKNWSWWMVSDHKFLFSPKSIRLLVEKAGFFISEIGTHENTYDFKKNLDGNFTLIENSFIRKISKALFYSCFFSLYFLFRKAIWLLGYGGLIVTIGV